MLRSGDGDALGEKELEEDLGDHLIKIGCGESLAKNQVQRLRRARDFVAKKQEENEEEEMEKELEEEMVSEEEGSLEVSEDDVVDWRDSAVDKVKEGSFGTDTHSAEDGKATVVRESKSGVFSEDLTDFSHLAKKFRMNPLVKISLSRSSSRSRPALKNYSQLSSFQNHPAIMKFSQPSYARERRARKRLYKLCR